MKQALRLFTALLFTALSFHATAQAVITDRSVTPPMVTINSAAFPGVQAHSLISSADTLPGSPAFRFGSSADGAGILKNTNGGYTMIVDHESNMSVSRIQLDSTFTPVSGEYVLNSNSGMWRLCSATLAVPQVQGFGPTFITGAESNLENYSHAFPLYNAPVLDSLTAANTLLAKGLGRWRVENAVPLPLATFGQTIVVIGDDDGGLHAAQLVMYIADAVGDLQHGHLYVMRRTNQDQRERDIVAGVPVNVEFVEIPNYMNRTGAQLDQYSDDSLKCIKIQRIEDLDYRKGPAYAAREIYFAATGSPNADSVDRCKYGRVYRLQLDSLNPLTGKLTCVLDADHKSPSNPAAYILNPDNICVTEDYVYVEEDQSGYWEPSLSPYLHNAAVHQYDIETGNVTKLLEMNYHLHDPDSAEYNRDATGTFFVASTISSWEYGAMLDLTSETGIENAFSLDLQMHTWHKPEFTNPDGGTKASWVNEGSMIVTLTGVPRIKARPPFIPAVAVCEGQSATLIAYGGSTFASTNGTVYNWYTSPSGGTPFFTGSVYVTPPLTNSTVYFVEASVSGMTSSRTPAIAGVNPAPATPTITVSGDTLTSSATSGNQWFRNNLAIAGATTQQYIATQSGFYAVQTTGAGCTSALSNDTLVLASVQEQLVENGVSVYPNPGAGLFNVEVLNGQAEEILVLDPLGRVVFSEEHPQAQTVIHLEEKGDGIYFLIVRTLKGTVRSKLVKGN